MKNTLLITLLLTIGLSGYAQYNLSIEWTEYDEGEIVTNTATGAPFIPSLRIRNLGFTALHEGDSICFGYTVDGERLNLNLNVGYNWALIGEEDFVIGQYMDFPPPPEYIIVDAQTGGGEVEICAMVYGVGLGAEDYSFSTDTNPSDNKYCITALTPDLLTIAGEDKLNYDLYMRNDLLHVFYNGAKSQLDMDISIYTISGQIMHTEKLTVTPGKTEVNLSHLSPGIYIVQSHAEGINQSKKIIIQP